MIGLIITIISFLIASTGFLGGDIIFALDVLKYWYYFVALAMVFFMLVSYILINISIKQQPALLRTIGLGGTVLLSLLNIAKISIQIWLVIWLMTNIDPNIQHFSELSSKEVVAGIVLMVLAIIKNINFKFNKRERPIID